MLKAKLSSLLFAVLASMSLAVAAAETKTQPVPVVNTAEVAPVGKINLNTADVATLQRELLGVGAVKAQAIVAYRDEHGDFASVDELLEVKGIGAATLEKNRDKLSIN
ncbi:MAG: helix-hairpin-helix domain-containing protein [Pseudomonas sp.]|uniref:ComEA family DNA-binding protein n=1 Tax=Pseudomonas sp. TaxID=306 RepID=UPI0027280C91|nr:helix-hairpin-helix domain-containing protein [Pseudomonas sp.]MDO9616063.1 helix-hairpin-helix domain-containing protein [Pseudomonas sp.]MDP2446234.1 helix-hairpin-helix domain-containing protein [Pseudomonas sp.]